MTAISKSPTKQANQPRYSVGRLSTNTSNFRYTIIRCLAAGQAFHRPPQALAHLTEHPPLAASPSWAAAALVAGRTCWLGSLIPLQGCRAEHCGTTFQQSRRPDLPAVDDCPQPAALRAVHRLRPYADSS